MELLTSFHGFLGKKLMDEGKLHNLVVSFAYFSY